MHRIVLFGRSELMAQILYWLVPRTLVLREDCTYSHIGCISLNAEGGMLREVREHQ